MNLKILWNQFKATTAICSKKIFDGSFLCVAGEYLVLFLRFFVLVLVWKTLAKEGADLGGFSLGQLLTYTLLSSALRQQFEIVTPATSALWEGSIIGRYTRPMPVITSLIAETIGRWWIPVFLFYSLPLLVISPLLGISPLPAGLAEGGLAVVSLLLSVSLGFALDLIFAAFAIRLKNGCWAVNQIREAIAVLMSGALIPFALLPQAVGRVLALLPFGSIASAPLTIYVGTADPLPLLLIQLFWNVVMWVAALRIFRKSEERMISFGG